MLQIVRRKTEAAAASSKQIPVVGGKERRLKFALVSLASANLFVISSVAALYFLVHF
jgi:hypothetical protein